jgi:hypothetical protein
MPTSSLLLLCQFLEPSSPVAERGSEVVVAARGADRAPLQDLALVLEVAGGTRRALGLTDARGELRFVAEPEGDLVVSAELPGGGPKLLAPLRVVPPPRRWLWFVLCGSLGAAVLWQTLRTRAGAARSPASAGPGDVPGDR